MIRFSCPHCGRPHLLPDALTRLPLVCKGCGQRVDVPDPQPDAAEEPEPLPKTKPKSFAEIPALPPPEPESAVLLPLPPPPEGQVDLFPEGAPKLPGEPPAAPPRRGALPVVLDVVVGLVLAAGGLFAAGLLLGKPVGQIAGEAAGPKFPSADLVVAAGLPAALVLIYVVLAGRGRSLGGWLRRGGGGSS